MAEITLNEQETQDRVENLHPSRWTLIFRYLRRNMSLTIGLVLLLFLAGFTIIGRLSIDPSNAYPLAVASKQPPSAEYPLGTDFFGRDMLAVMVLGTWQTAVIGLLAGGIGIIVGVFLGFVSAYFGGAVDKVVKGIR